MEKIDLTECNNLGYKAKVDGYNDYGRICVENVDSGIAFLLSYRENGYVGIWSSSCPIVLGIGERKVMDFEIVPRDPETYRDWQVGDMVGKESDGAGPFSVIFRSGELVVLKSPTHRATRNFTCYQLFDIGYRLVLTDIEQQIIEEKKYKPQDGDVCFVKTAAGNCFIFIKRDHKSDEEIHSYACFDTNLWSLCSAKVSCVCDRQSIRELRPATENEKQKLFDSMEKQGKRWNAEKKVVDDIPKPHEFKKGEPVLVRNHDYELWSLFAYHEQAGDKHIVKTCFQTVLQSQCIPYNERTMHLLGTSEDYKEGER